MGLMTTLFSPSKGAVSDSELRGPVAWLMDTGKSGQQTRSGVAINEESAMTLSAVFASVRAISEDVAKLPIGLYERIGIDESRPMVDHRLHDLIATQPNEEMSPFDFHQAIVANAIMWHGGFAEIARDGAGAASQVWPVHPSRVHVRRGEAGRIFYEVREFDELRRMKHRIIESRDMIHVKGFNTTGLVGFLIANYAKESFGIYRAAEMFSSTFFGNGATMSGIVSYDNKLSPEAGAEVRRRMEERHTGPGNAWRVHILDHGAKFQPTSVDAEKSQLTQTLQFRVEDVARWFRIPPHKLQHLLRSTNNNIEHQAIEYVGDTIMPWLVRCQQEYRRKLIPAGPRARLFFKYDTDPLIQADTSTRFSAYAVAVNNGIMTRNEARSEEGLNPYPGGEKFLVQQNLAMVSDDGEPIPNNSGGGSDAEAMKAAAMPWLVRDSERIVAREVNAIKSKKNVTDEWLAKWYEGHKAWVAEEIAPAIQTLSRILDADATGLCERFADMHVGESQRQLATSKDYDKTLSGWSMNRPAWMAEFLTDEVSR